MRLANFLFHLYDLAICTDIKKKLFFGPVWNGYPSEKGKGFGESWSKMIKNRTGILSGIESSRKEINEQDETAFLNIGRNDA